MTQLHKMILNKEHHAYRRTLGLELASEYSRRGLSPKERMTDRFVRLCHMERPVILEGEKIVFTRTVANIPDVLTEEEWAAIKEKHYVHELGYISNLSPDYYSVISKGLLKIRKNADECQRSIIDSIIALSDRYLLEAKRIGREDIVQVLTRVPRYPARSFREALQFFRILHFALWLEGNYHMTVGRFDKYMYPYLKRDLEEGALTEDEAYLLVREFFLSFNKDSDLYPGVQQGDNGQSLMLGGVGEDGKEVYNLLTRLSLKASFENRMIDPKINLRVGKNTPIERFVEATELTRAGLGFPQYSNDDVVIPALERLGYERRDAENYTVAACWEFIIPGVGCDIVNIGALSYPKALEKALYAHLEDSCDFEQFFAHVSGSIKEEADLITENIKSVWFVPSPLLNLIMGCEADKGGKYNNFGVHGTGIATAADSLAAIKKYVFEEKTVSKQDILLAVKNNFEGEEELLHKLRFNAPKLGNNDDYVDSLATRLLDSFAASLSEKTNCRGGIYRAGTGSAMFYLWHANEIGASADGRLKGEPFGTNYSVSLFAKVKGPVSVIGSMTKQNFINAINGGPLTLEFHKSVFSSPDGTEKVASLVKRYIELGGHQLQVNTVDERELLDAQKNPDKYRHLVVRIWGWSAYFVELDKEYQDHVIRRQSYTL